MATKMHKLLALFLAITMLLSMTVFAIDPIPTVWRGNEQNVSVTAGENGYTFMSVYRSPAHAYEMSNHMVTNWSVDKNGNTVYEIPQTLMLVPADTDYIWTPNGMYSFGSSNYEVLYCCDAVTGYKDGIHYKRLNLEDSKYYDVNEAAHIRSIVTNAYPYVSLDQMKANLAAEGFADAYNLTRAEVITAVQAAIWAYANNVTPYEYGRTFDIPSNSQWGTVMHDYTNELRDADGYVWWPEANRAFATDTAVSARIAALIAHLKAQSGTYAQKNQVLISDLEIVDSAPVLEKNNVYTVALQAKLNNSGSSVMDTLMLSVYVDGMLAKTIPVTYGTEVYSMTVEAAAGQTIKAVVSGTQIIPTGVYFYEPVGGRDVSQSLVGVASGPTEVYADAEVILNVSETITGTLNLQKVDGYGIPLSGAAFDLFVQFGTESAYIDTYAVNANGQLTVPGLMPGNYKLVESVVPQGYRKCDDVYFSINAVGGLEGADVNNGTLVVVNNLPNPTVTVQYIDKDSGEPIYTAYTADIVNGSYDVTTQANMEFAGYNRVGDSGNITGSNITSDVVVTVYYEKEIVPTNKFTVTVKYVDENGNSIRADYTEAKDAGSLYDVTSMTKVSIPGYEFQGVAGNESGILNSNEVIIVTYKKTIIENINYTIYINYIDTNGNVLQPSQSFIFPAGSSYNVAGFIPIIIGSLSRQSISGDPFGILNSDMYITAVYGVDFDPYEPPYTPEEEILPPEEIPLADIPSVFSPDHFAYIIGYTDGLVHPEANITRAEVATIFFRLLSDEVREANLTGENDFLDVNPGMWFNNAISTMAAMGIVTGDEDGNFRPDDYITRAEFAAIAARFDPFGSTDSVSLSDISGHWAEELICIAANNGWIKGYDDGNFRPDNLITRAESMTLINRVLHRIPETVDDLLDYMIKWPDNMDITKWYYIAVQEATNSHHYNRRDSGYEFWLELREVRDWTVYEK